MLKTFGQAARMLMFPFREASGSLDLPGFQSVHRQENAKTGCTASPHRGASLTFTSLEGNLESPVDLRLWLSEKFWPLAAPNGQLIVPRFAEVSASSVCGRGQQCLTNQTS